MGGQHRWKVLSFVLAVAVGIFVLVPPAGAAVRTNITDTLSAILSTVTAVKAKTDALPPDPAAASDVAAARSALTREIGSARIDVLGAIGTTGVFGRRSFPYLACADLGFGSGLHSQRAITLTIETDIDATAQVNVHNSLTNLSYYNVETTAGHPETLVESTTGPEELRVCNFTSGATMVVSAIWTETAA